MAIRHISFRLEEKFIKRLQEVAERWGMSQTQVIEIAITQVARIPGDSAEDVHRFHNTMRRLHVTLGLLLDEQNATLRQISETWYAMETLMIEQEDGVRQLSSDISPAPLPPKKRGRKPGSKNKPKTDEAGQN